MTIAVSSICIGVYGYPIDVIAIALAAVRSAVLEYPAASEVIFCRFSAGDKAVYQAPLETAA